ncbi:MAG: GIY-YIG nuclease family protein [Candidatus Komeilibacteria bacterium]
MNDHIYTAYILSNKYNTCLYVGMTGDLVTRLEQHRTKFVPTSFSAKYNTTKLLYFEHFGHPLEAIQREKQIKHWRRDKKLWLIKKYNSKFIDLYELAMSGEELVPREE